jgi:hypothetical protein
VPDHRDTFWDPDDGSGEDEWIRIDLMTREVWTRADGRRWLTVIAAPFDRNTYVQVKVHLDTDGDGSAEFVMVLQSWDMSGEPCWLRGLQGGRKGIEGRFRRLEPGGYPQWMGPVACRVSLDLVRPTTRIAWWAGARHHDPTSEVFDRAPNSGWYT